MDIRSIFRNCDGDRRGDAEGYASRVMDVPICQHKWDPAGKSTGSLTMKLVTRPQGRKVADAMPPGKSSKGQSPPQPYRKPTQGDEANIQRGSREHSFRNSAN